MREAVAHVRLPRVGHRLELVSLLLVPIRLIGHCWLGNLSLSLLFLSLVRPYTCCAGSKIRVKRKRTLGSLHLV